MRTIRNLTGAIFVLLYLTLYPEATSAAYNPSVWCAQPTCQNNFEWTVYCEFDNSQISTEDPYHYQLCDDQGEGTFPMVFDAYWHCTNEYDPFASLKNLCCNEGPPVYGNFECEWTAPCQ